MKDNSKPLVSIRCLVYNHEPYLRQCLDGFVMQKTDFAFEAIVHDDASTDNSAAIIREYAEKYPDIIKPIYETENQYSKKDGSLSRIMNEAVHPAAKYIAFCEGDDYWTNPVKLQKQVEILEEHPNVTMVYSNFETVDANGNHVTRERYEMIKQWSRSGNLLSQLLYKGNCVMTLTTVYRREILLNEFIDNSPKSLDYLCSLFAAANGDLYYLNEVTGSYRYSPSGQMATNLSGVQNSMNIIRYYIEYCCIYNKFKNVDATVLRIIKEHFLRTTFTSLIPRQYRYRLFNLYISKPSLIPLSFIVLCKYGIKKILRLNKLA